MTQQESKATNSLMNSEVIGETGELKHVNRYGFFGDACNRKLSSDPVLENQRLRKWMEMLRNWNTYQTEKKDVLQRRIRKGIPDALRGRVWCLLLSADVCSDIYNKYYEDCLSKEMAEDDPFTSKGGVIDRDINRTYPQNEVFSEIGGVGQESLRRVLLAFANHNKEIRYTQGMNYIVGLFLLYMSEKEAFWALCQLMENSPFFMTKWFNQDLTMVHTSDYQMEKLMEKYIPAVGQYLKEINIQPVMYMTEWFMCVFSRTFPYDIVVRVWDIFLAEGWRIVYQVALALMKLNEKAIVGQEYEDVFELIRNFNGETLPPAEELIQEALTFPITDEELESLRKEFARTKMTRVDLS